MQYPEILQYLHDQLPMFHRVGPAAYKANLDNTLALSEYFNYPERKFKSIHIAGTNGKGSVAHMIASVLQEKGLKTGLGTSPHLKDFRERIRVDGKMISKEYICNFFNNHLDFINHTSPSFFEMTIALTFKYFADEKVDVAVIETGMGGRLDSTNIISPLLSVITNIGLDHANLLGNTIEKIAVEKAGIIKPKTPVVVGRTQNNIFDIFIRTAEQNNCECFFADKTYKVTPLSINDNTPAGAYKYLVNRTGRQDTIEAGLGGIYQAENIATVLQSFDILNSQAGLNISDEQVYSGIKNVVSNTGLMGRWQVLGLQPLVICDTGHNAEAVKIILDHLNNLQYEKLHFVLGLMNDKDIDDILMLLPEDALYYFTNAKLPRALDAYTLQDKARRFDLQGEAHETVDKAFTAAKSSAGRDDLVFVGGSTFVIAEVL